MVSYLKFAFTFKANMKFFKVSILRIIPNLRLQRYQLANTILLQTILTLMMKLAVYVEVPPRSPWSIPIIRRCNKERLFLKVDVPVIPLHRGSSRMAIRDLKIHLGNRRWWRLAVSIFYKIL